ncbi:MAG TPA: ABC-F family ATP-binding cassette domain-containing protein [Sphingobium sp.]|nr:ABC-F family ATP-binding cassette domain-containing protein [Sphingobium sp.]
MPAPALLTLDRIAAARPDGPALFSDLTLAVGRERIGLVGRNGCGKSTLLAIVAGDAQPKAGHIHRAGRIAMLRQIPVDATSVAEALGVAPALACLDRIDAGAGTVLDAAEADWTLRERLVQGLDDVGLGHIALDRDPGSLSGGERVRLALAAMLLEQPELLLLDEPTNNLDLEGRAAVAGLLARWPGGALVASHDRALLEGMDRIVQLSSVGVLSVRGGWSAFVAQRDAQRAQAEEVLERSLRDLAQRERSAQRQNEKKARRDKAGRATAAKGGLPRILLGARARQAEASGARDRHIAQRQMTEAEGAVASARERVEVLTPLTIAMPPTGLPANRTLLRLDAVKLDRGGRHLFGPLSLTLIGPRRMAIAGPNGSGKSSLLAIIAGSLEPTGGTVQRAEGAIALLDQSVSLLAPNQHLVEAMRAQHPNMTMGEAYAALARFAFRNRDALKAADVLSGGERLRAGLALVLAAPRPPQLLILDEPTNHLDLDAIEVLEEALCGYDGALIVVSHDERFLDRIGVEEHVRLGV